MATLNQATVIGYVGDEPRIAQTQNNQPMASFALATTERGYQKTDGTQVPDRTEWHNIVFFGKPAEVIGKHVHKGSLLFVQGKLRTRSYEDKDKIKRYVTEIIGENFQFLDRRDNNTQQQPVTSGGYQTPPTTTPGKDDDLPF